jgi:ATP-dependent 26S proteasome regulatory subunit
MSERRRSTASVLSDLVARCASVADLSLAEDLFELAAELLEEHDQLDAAHDPLGRLCRAFDLTSFERDLLVLAGLPEEHDLLARLARTLHPLGEARLSVPMAAKVLGLDARGRRHLRRALEGGPLRRHALVTGLETAPLPERGFRLLLGLWNVLRGIDHWPDTVTLQGISPIASETFPEDTLLRAVDGDRCVVVVSGDGSTAGVPRSADELASLVAGALRRRGVPWTGVPAHALDGVRDCIFTGHTVARGAVPLVVGVPDTPPLANHPLPVVLCVDTATGVHFDDRPIVTLDLSTRSLGETVDMWAGVAPELHGGTALLAGLLRVDHVRASRAISDARIASELADTPMTVRDVVRSARHRADTTLPASVRLTKPDASWETLVVTAEQDRLLRSVVDRVEAQVQVLHEWGFAAARGTRGVRVLLTGSPGTGKTLSAEVIAAHLGLDLLVVDLSALVSKWLGETEKNIAAVFDAAERCQAVLFFDEADAIFGRRTDSGDAQSRWANLETAYLLGRVDRFDGLVVLATNLRANIDDAFVRRLDVIVEFDEPDLEARVRLWQEHLPSTAPLALDVDLRELGTLYPVTGGLIRNAALAAAFSAAAHCHEIDQRTLAAAMYHEYQKAGRSFPGMPRTLTAVRTGVGDGPEPA